MPHRCREHTMSVSKPIQATKSYGKKKNIRNNMHTVFCFLNAYRKMNSRHETFFMKKVKHFIRVLRRYQKGLQKRSFSSTS